MTAYSNEKWVDISGFEGFYQVSNLGRVRSCDRYLRAAHGGKQIKKGQLIVPAIRPNGYLAVGLNRNGIHKSAYVHRLVAFAFIANPNGYNEINHKDEDKSNNRADNLEWCSHYYNINYGTTRARISKSHLEGGYGAIPVVQKLNGQVVAVYKSATDASKVTGICSSAIRKCCLGRPRFNTAGGYTWENL